MSPPTVYLRVANMGDLETVKRLTNSFITTMEVPFNFDEETVTSSFRYIVEHPEEGIIILACSKTILGEVIYGMIIGAVTLLLYSKTRMATEVAWYIDPQFRGKTKASIKLIEAYEYWAEHIAGCEVTHLARLNNSPQSIDKFYERLGYEQKEVNFLKWL
jgi:hypothetical protein